MRWVAILVLVVAGCTTVSSGSGSPTKVPSGENASAPDVSAAWVRTEPPASLPAMARTELRAEEDTLLNGLRVVVVPHHARPMVKIRLFLPSGAAADPEDRTGVTYFATAALLDTHDRKNSLGDLADPSEKSARQLILDLGAAPHFDVTEDRASLGVDGFSVDTDRYLQKLYNVIRESRHGEESFSARIQAVSDMLEELDLTDHAVLEAYLAGLAFGDGHPYARPIYGTAETVWRLGIDDVQDRQAALLVPKGSTLLVVGDVDPAAVLQTATRLFGAWRAQPRAVPPVRAPSVSPRRSVTFIPRSPAKTTVVCAGRPLTDITAPSPTLSVLARVLSRRLDAELRERRGLTYDARATLLELQRGRALVACSRLDASEISMGLGFFLDTLGRLATSPISREELDAAKATLIAENEASTDELDGAVRVWAEAIARDTPVSLSGRTAGLRAVTGAELQALATKVMRLPVFQMVVSGDRAQVEPAVRANKLGALRTPRLSRAPTD